jgi:selenide,water dikinase
VLEPLRAQYARQAPSELLTGLAWPDDAAVYQLDPERALIMTTDFFPPILDDPYVYGAVAAANARSDVYAMGGEALMAINLVGWPSGLDGGLLESVLRGGADKVAEAGAFIAGGHTVADSEPKYGMAVVGLVSPDRILRKGGGTPGDLLVLTKALGSGTITTSIKRGKAIEGHVEACVRVMTGLNRSAARVAQSVHPSVHAATDVSGFGLLGHAHEMATQSGCSIRVDWEELPWIQGAVQSAKSDHFADGAVRNADFYGQWTKFERELANWQRLLLFDPQTSGGLLLAVEAEGVTELLLGLEKQNEVGSIVGAMVAGTAGEIVVS